MLLVNKQQKFLCGGCDQYDLPNNPLDGLDSNATPDATKNKKNQRSKYQWLAVVFPKQTQKDPKKRR
jgi:hypothetical protein